MHHKHRERDFLLGAMVGSTLGAFTAVMFTKNGHKIKKELMHKYHEFQNTIHKYAHKAKKKLKSASKRVAKRKSLPRSTRRAQGQ